MVRVCICVYDTQSEGRGQGSMEGSSWFGVSVCATDSEGRGQGGMEGTSSVCVYA